MYSLFTDMGRLYGATITPSWFKETRDRVTEDVEHVVTYYHHGAFRVKTQHLLARLITTMNVPLAYDVDHYYETASARALFVANNLEFTTSINVGKWFKGVFYANCDELIIAYNGMDRPSELEKDWRNLQAVRVLEHPISDMHYLVPNGNENSIETGLAVIGIDIPALMVQYRSFIMEQRLNAAQGGEFLSVYHFVGKYVLPNMLHSQTDLVLLNRLINLHLGKPMGSALRKHVFHISDYTHWLDRGLNEILKRIETVRMDYNVILHQIPTIFNSRPYQMPDIAETRQVWWALFITRWKLIDFLLSVAGENGKHFNQTLVNTLKLDLKRFKSDNVMAKHLPIAMYDDFQFFAKHV